MPVRLDRLAGWLLIALFAQVGPSHPAHAAPAEREGDARAFAARLFVGLESGLAVGYTTPGGRLSIELSQAVVPFGHLGSLTEIAVATRTAKVGPWLGARVGYQLALFQVGADVQPGGAIRDVSHTGDVGVILGASSQGGYTVALELGIETVQRAQALSCCDSGLAKSSYGPRALLIVELALDRRVAVFTRLGIRAGAHLLELETLPILMLGVAVAF